MDAWKREEQWQAASNSKNILYWIEPKRTKELTKRNGRIGRTSKSKRRVEEWTCADCYAVRTRSRVQEKSLGLHWVCPCECECVCAVHEKHLREYSLANYMHWHAPISFSIFSSLFSCCLFVILLLRPRRRHIGIHSSLEHAYDSCWFVLQMAKIVLHC